MRRKQLAVLSAIIEACVAIFGLFVEHSLAWGIIPSFALLTTLIYILHIGGFLKLPPQTPVTPADHPLRPELPNKKYWQFIDDRDRQMRRRSF